MSSATDLSRGGLLRCVGLLLLGLLIVLGAPQTLTPTEAQMALVVQDTARPSQQTVRTVARQVRDSLLNALNNVLGGTPIWIQQNLLNTWQLAVGETDFSNRWLSNLLSMIALAAILRLARFSGDNLTIIASSLLVLSAYAFINLANSFDGSTLVLTCGLLTALTHITWQRSGKRTDALLYASSALFTIVSYWPGLLLIIWQLVQARRQRLQHRRLVFILLGITSTAWIIILVIMGQLLPLLLLSPQQLVSLMALLAALAVWFWLLRERRSRVRLLGLGVLIALQATLTIWLFTSTPNWRAVAGEIAQARQPLEPLLVLTPPEHPISYYVRQTTLSDGLVLRLGWQVTDAQMIANAVHSVVGRSHVWLIVNQGDAVTTSTLEILSPHYINTYQAHVDDTLFYRFTYAEQTTTQP